MQFPGYNLNNVGPCKGKVYLDLKYSRDFFIDLLHLSI
jgi:hypothetical protein